jgi:hypothetical protein
VLDAHLAAIDLSLQNLQNVDRSCSVKTPFVGVGILLRTDSEQMNDRERRLSRNR